MIIYSLVSYESPSERNFPAEIKLCLIKIINPSYVICSSDSYMYVIFDTCPLFFVKPLVVFFCFWSHLLRQIRNLDKFWSTWTSMLQCMCPRMCENWCSLIPTLFQTGSIFLTRGHLVSCKAILTSGKWVPLWWSQRNRFWFHILSLFSWWRILHILSRKIRNQLSNLSYITKFIFQWSRLFFF